MVLKAQPARCTVPLLLGELPVLETTFVHQELQRISAFASGAYFNTLLWAMVDK